MKERATTSTLTDAEMLNDSKNNQHRRQENLLNHFNRIVIIFIYAVSALVIFLAFVLVFRAILQQDWAFVNSLFGIVVSFSAGYFVSYLRQNGIQSDTTPVVPTPPGP